MTADNVARRLGEELTARGLWRPGMRLLGEYGDRYPVRLHGDERPFDVDDAAEGEPLRWWQQAEEHGDTGPYPGPYVPDLTDFATAGVLLGLLGPGWEILIEEDEADLYHPGRGVWVAAPTLGEAAARALLALWGVE